MARDRPPTKKRRISQHHDASQDATAAASEPITNCRELQDAMAYTGAGIRRVRDFLNRCSNGPADIDETEVTRNRAILREYLELQMKRAKATSAEDAEEDASGAFADVAQMWAYAFQVRFTL